MEPLLRTLFEYQRFAENPRLEEVISRTLNGCAALSDDELERVSAAGDAAFASSDDTTPDRKDD